MGKIERVTMFKVPRPEDRLRALEQFKVMKRTAVKDGKPYILTVEAGLPADEPRAQGWNVAVKSTFTSKADMDYYDKECVAHQELKRLMAEIRTDVLTVWFESVLGGIGVVGEEGKGEGVAKVDRMAEVGGVGGGSKAVAEGGKREEQPPPRKELNGNGDGKGKGGVTEHGNGDSKTQAPTKPAKKGFFTKWREDTASAYSKLGPGGHQRF